MKRRAATALGVAAAAALLSRLATAAEDPVPQIPVGETIRLPAGAFVMGDDTRGGGPFYDLLGNLWEWVHDWWWEPDPLVAAVDAWGPSTGEARILRGTPWWRYTDNPRSALRRPLPDDYLGGHVGFRIARTARD